MRRFPFRMVIAPPIIRSTVSSAHCGLATSESGESASQAEDAPPPMSINSTSESHYGPTDPGWSSPDAYGPFASKGFNLIGKKDGSTGFSAATDKKGTIKLPLDPKLGPLQSNGGPTQTMALLPGSPAIDKGTSVGLIGTLTTDQRGTGFPRKIDNLSVANAAGGDGTDIGAFELAAP